MKNYAERKQELFPIIDGYATFLKRQKSDEYTKLGEELLKQKKVISRDRYYIALIGFVNRGKSTILNTLLGDRQNDYNPSPVSVLSTTAAIVEYRDSKLHPDEEGREGAIIRFSDHTSEVIGIAEISRYVDQNNPGFRKDLAEKIKHIEVYRNNIPLIETKGVFVDTPGMGALYDQDYLAQDILTEVDVILCPISADFPLSKDEEIFLRTITEKKKLMFALTKVDDVEPDELPEIVAKVQEKINAITGETPVLYQLAAKKVLDAYKAGKSDIEIEKVKETCGIKALENALEKKLHAYSSAENNIKSVCHALEGYFITDKSRLTEIKEELSLQSAQLEEKRKALETACVNIKSDYGRCTKKLKQQWEKAVNRFISKLETMEGSISDRLISAVEKENLLSLIGYSAKLQRKIQSILRPQLNDELNELNIQLGDIVADFKKELKSAVDENIELYSRSYPGNSLKYEVGTLIGGGVAAGGAYFGATAVTGALSSISAAAAGLTAASGEAAAAVASSGIFTKLGAWLFGTTKIASTAGTAAAAQGALVTALTSSVLPILGGVVVVTLAYRFGTGIAKNQTAKSIPQMVETQLQDAAKSVKDASEKMLDYVFGDFQNNLETSLTRMQDELEAINKEDRDLDAKERIQEIERDKQELDTLSTNLTRFMNSMGM